ncbi:MAG: methionyl-tRNA formyltransferase [Sphaerochaetaceae bacterium]
MPSDTLRILYAGNPELSVETFEELCSHFDVAGVLTHPDQVVKRGRLQPMPVKEAAIRRNVPVIEAERLTGEVRDAVRQLQPNLLISFATSHYFGEKFLSLFSLGAFNIHPSLLPLHRGPSPIQFTILNQDTKGGISIQHIVKEIDSGDILNQIEFEIAKDETTESLSNRVSSLAAAMAVETFSDFDLYKSKQWEQDHSRATFTRMFTKEDGLINWDQSRNVLSAHIRAMYPWPKAYTYFDQTPLIITEEGGECDQVNDSYLPGTVVSFEKKKGLKIACADSFIYVKRLQLSKKKEMDSASFVNGNRQILNTRLGEYENL